MKKVVLTRYLLSLNHNTADFKILKKKKKLQQSFVEKLVFLVLPKFSYQGMKCRHIATQSRHYKYAHHCKLSHPIMRKLNGK